MKEYRIAFRPSDPAKRLQTEWTDIFSSPEACRADMRQRLNGRGYVTARLQVREGGTGKGGRRGLFVDIQEQS